MFAAAGPEGPAMARHVNAPAKDSDGSMLCATYSGLYRLRRAGGRLSFRAVEIGLPEDRKEGGLVNNLSPSRYGGWIGARYGLFHLSAEANPERITTHRVCRTTLWKRSMKTVPAISGLAPEAVFARRGQRLLPGDP